MKIEGNRIFNDTGPIASFNEKFEVSYLVDDLERKDKMLIGRLISPYKKGAKPFPIIEETPIEPPVIEEDEFSVFDLDPWDAFEDCPPQDSDGDKTEAIVEFLYANHPEYYKRRYLHRKTHIDIRNSQEKRHWIDIGEQYANQGMHIGSCPANATESQKGFFFTGFDNAMQQKVK